METIKKFVYYLLLPILLVGAIVSYLKEVMRLKAFIKRDENNKEKFDASDKKIQDATSAAANARLEWERFKSRAGERTGVHSEVRPGAAGAGQGNSGTEPGSD